MRYECNNKFIKCLEVYLKFNENDNLKCGKLDMSTRLHLKDQSSQQHFTVCLFLIPQLLRFVI